MKRIFILLVASAFSLQTADAQTVKRLPSGIEAKTIKFGKVTKKAKVGDMINTVIEGRVSGKTIYSTKTSNKGMPVNFMVEKPKYKGDVMEGILQMNEGDSTVFYIPADSFFRGGKPPYYKAGDKVIYNVKINWIKTPAQVAKERKDYDVAVKAQAEQKRKMDKMFADQKKAQAAATALAKKDRATIQKYATDNGLNVQTTKSGLSYIITKEGAGDLVPNGKQVSMNYTGRLLDGTPFDSNTDSAFGHVQPLTFVLGTGRVIKGWDEGIALLKKGSQAKLLIPSDMAYGPNAQNKIPANSNMVFDVEVLDVMDAPPPPPPAPATPAAAPPPAPAPPTPEKVQQDIRAEDLIVSPADAPPVTAPVAPVEKK
jgi:FKBP-type peptidyl-prolyl cis-trans isomerase FkpA